MNSAERFLKLILAVLQDWYASLGQAAWLVLGLILALGVAIGIVAFRWLRRGHLSRYRSALFSGGSHSNDRRRPE